MTPPTRFIGLDIHKDYFVAAGVNAAKEMILRPRKIANSQLESWIARTLTPDDAVVLEMTTNAYTFYDALLPHVHSVTVVHPPHLKVVVESHVKTDKRAAVAMAQQHAGGPLVGIWVPPAEVRDRRALVAQRQKMIRLGVVARNRLHSLLHRHHLKPPAASQPFQPQHKDFWLSLPVSRVERVNAQLDWETIEFAERQKTLLEAELLHLAADDERTPLLVQFCGIGAIGAVTLLAAIGDIQRFETPKKLVGYAGLGARVHDSGKTHHTGRITKTGRKDIRYTMIEAARHAVRHQPHWKTEYVRLARRLGDKKAIVAIARRLLVGVWHVLTYGEADRFGEPAQIAAALFGHAYDIQKHLPPGERKLAYVRSRLDRLGIGKELTQLPWGSKKFKLPPSRLTT
jgi:transposase